MCYGGNGRMYVAVRTLAATRRLTRRSSMRARGHECQLTQLDVIKDVLSVSLALPREFDLRVANPAVVILGPFTPRSGFRKQRSTGRQCEDSPRIQHIGPSTAGS